MQKCRRVLALTELWLNAGTSAFVILCLSFSIVLLFSWNMKLLNLNQIFTINSKVSEYQRPGSRVSLLSSQTLANLLPFKKNILTKASDVCSTISNTEIWSLYHLLALSLYQFTALGIWCKVLSLFSVCFLPCAQRVIVNHAVSILILHTELSHYKKKFVWLVETRRKRDVLNHSVGESVSNPHSGHHCYTSLLCNAVMMSSRYNVHCPEDTGPAVFSKAALYAHKYLNTPACVCACNAYMHALTCAHKYTLTKSHSYSCNQTHELCVQNFWHLWDRLISGKRLSQAS